MQIFRNSEKGGGGGDGDGTGGGEEVAEVGGGLFEDVGEEGRE